MRHQSAVLAQLIARFTCRVFCNPKIGQRFDRDPATFTATKSPFPKPASFPSFRSFSSIVSQTKID
ncbi:hypothetical protein [Burkholderia cepacia]|uniref:hypothetical protein n=1 Tax=Burkholderia cepacia TaxID=292 RepID=UPI0035284DAD